MTFGDYLARLRKLKGLSQEELAELLLVSRQAISKWERDVAIPSTENMLELSKIFGVSIDDLLNKKEEIKQDDKLRTAVREKGGKIKKNIAKGNHKTLKLVGFLLLILVVVNIVYVAVMSR